MALPRHHLTTLPREPGFLQLDFAHHVAHVQRMIDAALLAADPFKAVVRAWEGSPKAARPPAACVLVAAGKAAMAMSRAAIEVCGLKPVVGIVVAPGGSPTPRSLASAEGGGGGGIRIMPADHPLPTQRNLIAAQAVLDTARIASSRGLPLVVLLSGGASAYLTFPARGLALSDVRTLTDLLLRAGAPIRELNTVRKHVERLKGGGLARAAAPSPVFAYILSDVLGEPPPLDAIGSGPTAPDPTTFAEALSVLESRGVLETSPPTIVEYLRNGVKDSKGKREMETLKPGDPVCARVRNVVVGSNSEAVSAAVDAARVLGFHVAEARLNVEGDARGVGELLAERVMHFERERAGGGGGAARKPLVVVWGGETVVYVRGQGFGGRCQEFAAAAAVRLAGRPNVVLAAFATDGLDGVAPPGQGPVAGAIVTGETAGEAIAAGVDLRASLDANNTFAAMAALKAQIATGATGTNVNDLMIGMAYP